MFLRTSWYEVHSGGEGNGDRGTVRHTKSLKYSLKVLRLVDEQGACSDIVPRPNAQYPGGGVGGIFV